MWFQNDAAKLRNKNCITSTKVNIYLTPASYSKYPVVSDTSKFQFWGDIIYSISHWQLRAPILRTTPALHCVFQCVISEVPLASGSKRGWVQDLFMLEIWMKIKTWKYGRFCANISWNRITKISFTFSLSVPHSQFNSWSS